VAVDVIKGSVAYLARRVVEVCEGRSTCAESLGDLKAGLKVGLCKGKRYKH